MARRKYTDEDRMAFWSRYKNGETQASIAKELGIPRSQLNSIIHRDRRNAVENRRYHQDKERQREIARAASARRRERLGPIFKFWQKMVKNGIKGEELLQVLEAEAERRGLTGIKIRT